MRRGDCITTERLYLRHWDKASDGTAFHRLNNDPDVMQYFPGRRTRSESDVLLDRIEQQIVRNGYSWSAIELRSTNEIIGFGGIAKVEENFPNGPSAEIGWRFVPEAWGAGYASEMGKAVLRYGFEQLRLPEILSFAVVANEKSLAVMKRIGMQRFE
ncbi:MAG: GNAT family N-acetyltransferase, partial [Pseudomonadota bacterium]